MMTSLSAPPSMGRNLGEGKDTPFQKGGGSIGNDSAPERTSRLMYGMRGPWLVITRESAWLTSQYV